MSQKLPPAWEAVVMSVNESSPVYDSYERHTRRIVERCYALTQKPQRELTDAECYNLWLSLYAGPFRREDWHVGLESGTDVIRRIEAAVWAKQQEPETVKFRAARNRNDHSEIYMAKADSDWSGSNWEWLPGEPQTIEVKLP